MDNTTVQYDFHCDNIITTDVEAPPPQWYRIVTVRCGNLVTHNPHDIVRVFCPKHQPRANTSFEEACRRDAYQDLLRRVDDPNDTFNEDDLELLEQDD
jgi:hypothetical protein